MVKIRNLSDKDLIEIIKYSAQYSWFSVPSKYILWMLSKTQKPFCKVLTIDNKVFAYFLALVTTRKYEIFVWQFGAQKIRNKSEFDLLMKFCKSYYRTCLNHGIKQIRFTSTPKGSKKLIQKIANSVKKGGLKTKIIYSIVPQTDINNKEIEYLLIL